MATPITGAISLSQVNTELGLSSTAAISFNDTLYRQLTNQLSGEATLGNARAAASVNTTTTNVNVLTGLFASSTTVTGYKVLVRSGVSVGASAGVTALTVGQFATGSTIVINNYGTVSGYGGAGGTSGVGTSGGDAINANYANQTVTINNQTGATLRGGGGGGGKGGTGGTGGQGYYTTVSAYQFNIGKGAQYYWSETPGGKGTSNYNNVWAGTAVGGSAASGLTYLNGYYKGSLAYTDPKSGQDYYTIAQATTVYTSGGAGGAGGNGGRGQGYDGANASGSAGSGGAAGGTNAGAGGTGGTGGAGAVYGSAGSTGSTGNTGASGNYTGGSAGAGGATGGASGRYLVKGANSVTLNNSGTVQGGLA